MSNSVFQLLRSVRVFNDIRSAVGAAKEFKRSADGQDSRTSAIAL